MNAAKYARKLKHIRKLKVAIRYQEQTRKRLAPIKEENKETKQYIVNKLGDEAVDQKDIRTVRKNNLEDWNLGPLRPNRAVGEDAQRYGALAREQMHRPDIPKHWFGAKEGIQKRMETQIPQNILRDQWPIVAGDRVVVIRGREKNKIGIVKQVVEKSNVIVLKDVNKVWADSRVFNVPLGENPPAKREWEHSMPYDNVRLLIPHTYKVTDVDDYGEEVQVDVRRDVIVEAIDMKGHSKVDQTTGEAIWHRYIAGTEEYIPWPWNTTTQKGKDDKQRKSSQHLQKKDESSKLEESSWTSKLNPFNRAKKLKKRQAEKSLQPKEKKRYDPAKIARGKPQDRELPQYDDDTPRNDVYIDDRHQGWFVPSLVWSPLPEAAIDELAGMRSSFGKQKPALAVAEDRRTREEAAEQTRQERIDSMKTPMQIRRQLEQAKKEKYDPKEPIIPSGDLLLALGKHMAKKGTKLDEERASKARRHAAKVVDLEPEMDSRERLAV